MQDTQLWSRLHGKCSNGRAGQGRETPHFCKDTYIHNTAVDVAKLLEAEEPGTMGGVIEDEALLDISLSRSQRRD